MNLPDEQADNPEHNSPHAFCYNPAQHLRYPAALVREIFAICFTSSRSSALVLISRFNRTSSKQPKSFL